MFSAVPLPEVIVLPPALHRHRAAARGRAGGVKPVPVVVVMSRPLPAALKLIVAPVLLVRLTAVSAPVLSVLWPLKLNVAGARADTDAAAGAGAVGQRAAERLGAAGLAGDVHQQVAVVTDRAAIGEGQVVGGRHCR